MDKPTQIYTRGNYIHFLKPKNRFHRKFYPGIISKKIRSSYKDGKFHNLWGPAFIEMDPDEVRYYINGRRLTKIEWEVQRLKYIST